MLKQCVSLESKKCHHFSRSLETGFNIFQVNNSYCHRKNTYHTLSIVSLVVSKESIFCLKLAKLQFRASSGSNDCNIP